MTARERIARAHFENERENLIASMKADHSGLGFKNTSNPWSKEQRAAFRAIERTTWESLEARDHDRFYALADVALSALADRKRQPNLNAALDQFAGRTCRDCPIPELRIAAEYDSEKGATP